MDLLLLLFTKHFVVDFPMQTQYQWQNKGIYGHPGGILHASLHAIGTLLMFFIFGTGLGIALVCALLDGVVHYHIDWAKVNLNDHFGYKPDTHPEFWWLLGADQYLHSLTYVIIAFMVI